MKQFKYMRISDILEICRANPKMVEKSRLWCELQVKKSGSLSRCLESDLIHIAKEPNSDDLKILCVLLQNIEKSKYDIRNWKKHFGQGDDKLEKMTVLEFYNLYMSV
jgi:hypothetical protein